MANFDDMFVAPVAGCCPASADELPRADGLPRAGWVAAARWRAAALRARRAARQRRHDLPEQLAGTADLAD